MFSNFKKVKRSKQYQTIDKKIYNRLTFTVQAD